LDGPSAFASKLGYLDAFSVRKDICVAWPRQSPFLYAPSRPVSGPTLAFGVTQGVWRVESVRAKREGGSFAIATLVCREF